MQKSGQSGRSFFISFFNPGELFCTYSVLNETLAFTHAMISIMLNKKRLGLIFYTFLLGACTVTGPADDGYDNLNEWVDNGRLFSGEKKTLYNSEKKQASVKPEQTSSVALDEKAEFEQFKRWNKLRTEDRESAEYQEFLQWLNYQSFKTSRQ